MSDRTHSDECWRWHQECAEALIEAQQAAIQRVRELAEFWKAQVADSPSGASWIYMSAASRLLLDALDGDGDE